MSDASFFDGVKNFNMIIFGVNAILQQHLNTRKTRSSADADKPERYV